MSQTELELLSRAAELVFAAFDAAVIFALWNIFYRPGKKKETIAVGSLLLAVNIFLEVWGHLPRYGHFLVLSVLVLGYSLVKYGRHCERSVLILTLFYGFRAMSFLAAGSLSDYLMDAVQKNLDVTSKDYLQNILRCALYFQILFAGLYIGFFVLMLAVLRKALPSVQKMSWHDVCFLSVLNVAGGLFAEVIINISMVELENDVFNLFHARREMYWKLPLIAALLFLGELSAVIIYQKYCELQKEREQHLAERQQVKAMKRRLEDAENFYGSIRRVRHEMKSHMMNLKGLAAGEQYGALGDYIAKLDGAVGELDYKYATGNAVTDVIINDKAKRAERAGIRFDVQFFWNNLKGIDVFDMGIVLNNLLDNAVTACERVEGSRRYIRLSLRQKKRFLLLEVENCFNGEFQSSEEGLPLTTKEVRLPDILMEHGIGLRNVREVAERYLGTMNIRAEQNIFKVTVMLQQQEK